MIASTFSKQNMFIFIYMYTHTHIGLSIYSECKYIFLGKCMLQSFNEYVHTVIEIHTHIRIENNMLYV